MTGINPPKLTDYDPVKSAEGALDPLGLYAIADNLAIKLVPGIRERMSHPRFLTAIAVGAAINRDFDEEALAADGQSEPYMVYEWHAVEGLVRQCDDVGLSGLPGILKTRDCIKQGLKLSAPRYLKTASVFGFHGVYRLLAGNLNIVRDGLLGDNGYELLSIWEKEQQLPGFSNGNNGTGFSYKTQIQNAIKDAIQKGHIDRTATWQGWAFFGDHLFPNKIPEKERAFLTLMLSASAETSRNEVFRFLVSNKGQSSFKESWSEKSFHQAFFPGATEETKRLLKAIQSYEAFSRLLQDAFDDCLVAMTNKRARIYPKELSELKGCVDAIKKIPEIFNAVADQIEPYGQLERYLVNFNAFSEKTSAIEWTNQLLEHHIKVQRNKPPNGKNPWFDRYDDGSVVIHVSYRREEGGRHDDSYVHMYRTN
ncbi:MAG: hypothetical protein ACOZBW_14370, partial [Thermodesulfobacteriota bacterium]